MSDPEQEEASQDVVQDLAVCAVEFRDGGEEEGDGDVFEEVCCLGKGARVSVASFGRGRRGGGREG